MILFATVASAATLIQLSKATLDQNEQVLGANKNSFLIGSSTALGLAFAFQILFLSAHFFSSRNIDTSAHSFDSLERLPPKLLAKSVRYSQTTSEPEPIPRSMNSMDSRTSPLSVKGRSRSGIMTSIKMQFSTTIRPVTSETELITRDFRRPVSVDSYGHRSSEDAFDSWDTSSVDTQNRQVVMEATTPTQEKSGHLLETIPGSPTPIRTPSPNTTVIPFELPRARTRSHSYSPSLQASEEADPLPSPPSMSELHIHPLFRSSSPTPPPIATPGTVVVASPVAGQVIAQRQSIRSLSQTRSVTRPAHSRPMSIRSRADSKAQRDDQSSIQEDVEENGSSIQPVSERTMTPPIPEWVLGAGPRSSLTGYNTRKVELVNERAEVKN